VNLPTFPAIAQKRAQKSRSAVCHFCASSARVNVPVPTHVPSFKRVGGNVTCYPSPSKRPVGTDGGPSFFGPGAGCPEKEQKKREEAGKSCAETKLWRSAFWPLRHFRVAWETLIWTAQHLVPAWVPWVLRLLAAMWRSASASGRLRARCATTLASATDTQNRFRLNARILNAYEGSFRPMPGWSFFVSA
jgi:hypothetical protein